MHSLAIELGCTAYNRCGFGLTTICYRHREVDWCSPSERANVAAVREIGWKFDLCGEDVFEDGKVDHIHRDIRVDFACLGVALCEDRWIFDIIAHPRVSVVRGEEKREGEKDGK